MSSCYGRGPRGESADTPMNSDEIEMIEGYRAAVVKTFAGFLRQKLADFQMGRDFCGDSMRQSITPWRAPRYRR